MDAEVLVVGVGSMGSMALWQLARRGVDVLGIERFQPGHDRGSGHGESRIIRSCHQEGPQYGPLIEAAWPLWRELAAEGGQEILTENGMLFLGRAGDPVFAEDRALGDARSFPYQLLSHEEVAARFPQHRLDPDGAAFLDLQGGFLRPEAAISAAAGLAQRHGARLITDTQVERVLERDGMVEVVTPAATLRGRRAIIAAGAWTDRVLPEADLRVEVERRVMFWFRPHEVREFAPDRFPAFIRDTGDLHWYGFPTVDGTTVKLALHGEGGEASDPDRLDRELHPRDWAALSETVRRCLPCLHPEPVRGQVCMYAQTEDGHFVLGFVPGSERLILLGPMLGHGFKFSSAVGLIGADLATEGHSSLPIEQFSPSRFKMTRDAGARA